MGANVVERSKSRARNDKKRSSAPAPERFQDATPVTSLSMGHGDAASQQGPVQCPRTATALTSDQLPVWLLWAMATDDGPEPRTLVPPWNGSCLSMERIRARIII